MLDNILSKDSSRRDFLINAGQAALSLMIAGTTSSFANQPSGTDKLGKTLPHRRLGKTGLMPINVADPSYRSFIINTMESMVEKDIGILAMKSLCMGGLFGRRGGSDRQSKVVLPTVIPNKISIAQAHAFALSMPIGSLVSGVDTPQQLHDNLKSIWDYKALTKEEQDELIALCRPEALTGKRNSSKVSPRKAKGDP